MGLITWKPEFSVQIKVIDAQHKKLLELINGLHEAMKKGKTAAAVSIVLKQLINYAAYHFDLEEKYMNQYDYVGYLEHKAEHETFTHKIGRFQESLNQGRKLTLTMDVMSFLKHWLVRHIVGSDKQYSPLFNEKGLH